MPNAVSDPLAWQPSHEPSLAELESCALEVFRRLPKQFRDLCADVVIQVDDFPTEEVLNALHVRSRFGLLGLFHGVGLPFREESAPLHMPNMIWLYRRPILVYWGSHEDTLGAIIQHVLIHEIGHHFGFSDGDMHAIERAAN
ncbi:MAG: metallopeptidase family protein [Xanthobacteraceae bacterium]